VYPLPQGQQGHQGRLAPLALGLAVVAAGCGSHRGASIDVRPAHSLSTEPLAIHVNGLVPHAALTLTLRSRDAAGVVWTSKTRLHADGTGNAVAGTRAVYRLTAPKHPNAFYIWPYRAAATFTASAAGVTATFMRAIDAAKPQRETVAGDGFFGSYYAQPRSGRHPALLVLGGSEGGLGTGFLAANLAGRGYPSLALAYFQEPGLPKSLRRIPLEYFAHALRWLAAQPDVDPSKIVVLGISRGSEAAQLLGVHYPKLVHGVVAAVPSDVVNCSYPGCADSAWTFRGRPLPNARIPDERIQGPVLLICAGQDEIWPSCDYAHDAMSHLAHDRFSHLLVVEPRSRHHVGALVPYEPNPESATVDADEVGREDAWPQLLAFLAAQ
jgi:dienelactone hydrolase